MLKSKLLQIYRRHNLELDTSAIYLMSAYTNPDKIEEDRRVLSVIKIAAMLRDAGVCCYSPIIHWHFVDRILPAHYDHYITNDLIMLAKHNIAFVCLTAGLRNSTGVRLEYQLAKSLNIPIYYISEEGEIFDGNDTLPTETDYFD